MNAQAPTASPRWRTNARKSTGWTSRDCQIAFTAGWREADEDAHRTMTKNEFAELWTPLRGMDDMLKEASAPRCQDPHHLHTGASRFPAGDASALLCASCEILIAANSGITENSKKLRRTKPKCSALCARLASTQTTTASSGTSNAAKLRSVAMRAPRLRMV